MLSMQRLNMLLAELPHLTIGLVGDLFLDRYLEISPNLSEMSVETGLEAYQVTDIRNAPGALGTVMNNLVALGVGQLLPVTVIGRDGHGFDLLESLKPLPVNTDLIIQDAQRFTPTYTKPLRRDHQGAGRELNRLDVRTREPLAAATCQRVLELARDVFAVCDGLIVLDQISQPECGVVNQHVRDGLAELQSGTPEKLVYIDSRNQLAQFTFGTLKGNESELAAAGPPGSSSEPLENAAALSRLTGRPVFVTRGPAGITVVTSEDSITHCPAFPVDGPLDIVGAGDAATSGIVTALLAGADVVEAATVGNLAASITITQLGTTGTASPDQLRERLKPPGIN